MGSWVQAPLVVVVARDQTPTCIVVAGVGANPSGGDRLLLAAGGMWLRAEDLTRCAPCFGIRASCPRHYPRRARHRVATGIELQLLGRYPFRVAVPSAVNLQRIHGFGLRFRTEQLILLYTLRTRSWTRGGPGHEKEAGVKTNPRSHEQIWPYTAIESRS